MSIYCSEKCVYQESGICTLNHVISSTGEIYNDCPYYKPINRMEEIKQLRPKD